MILLLLEMLQGIVQQLRSENKKKSKENAEP